MSFIDVAAYPDSVNVLDGIGDDIRTPDKLIIGDKDLTASDHMWLAPVLPSIVSLLIITAKAILKL